VKEKLIMTRLTKLEGLALVASVLAAVGAAAAQPSITYGGDTFTLITGNSDTDASWADAEAAANAAGGYLAVLPNQATIEAVYNGLINNALTTWFNNSGGGSQGQEAWLGAVPADGSHSTTNPNNWSWVTGIPAPGPVPSVVPWTVGDNFHPGEPNGDSEGLAINRYATYQFNDEGGYVGGYILEKGPVGGVPDTATTGGLLSGALLGLQMLRRKLSR
jgi:VPDSG-CTERM motif